MPTFLPESGKALPFDNITFNVESGVMSIPSGSSFPDVQLRTISDGATVLDGQILLHPTSGVLGIVTATSGWIGINFLSE